MEKVRQAAPNRMGERQRALEPSAEDGAHGTSMRSAIAAGLRCGRKLAAARICLRTSPGPTRKELVKQLFPEGLLFTNEPRWSSFAAMDACFQRISDDRTGQGPDRAV